MFFCKNLKTATKFRNYNQWYFGEANRKIDQELLWNVNYITLEFIGLIWNSDTQIPYSIILPPYVFIKL